MKRIGRILLCILMITVLFGISIVGNFVVKSENKSKEKKRTVITKEEMKEWAAPDEETLKYYDLGKFSTTLPVIYMNTKGQQILKENVICGHLIPAGTGQRELLLCWMETKRHNLFLRFPILYIVLRLNTEVPLLIVNLIKNNIALSFTKIVKRMKKKCHLQEWEQTVNGC